MGGWKWDECQRIGPAGNRGRGQRRWGELVRASGGEGSGGRR